MLLFIYTYISCLDTRWSIRAIKEELKTLRLKALKFSSGGEI